jgi:hypothetical protein
MDADSASSSSSEAAVQLSKLLHHDWPGDISLLIGSYLDETLLRVEVYEFVEPPPSKEKRGLGGRPRRGWSNPPPPPTRGRRLYEATQPFYAGLSSCAWPPSFELDTVESCSNHRLLLVLTAIGPRGTSKFAEEHWAPNYGPARGELCLKVTNWLCSHAPHGMSTDPPYVQVDTFSGGAAEPVKYWTEAGSPPPLTGPARLVVTLHVNDMAAENQLPYITSCGTRQLDRADSRALLEGAIDYRGEALPEEYGDGTYRGAQARAHKSLPTLGPGDFPQFRVELTCNNLWLTDATSDLTITKSAYGGLRACCIFRDIHIDDCFFDDRDLRCRVLALRGSEICTLFDDTYGHGEYSGYGASKEMVFCRDDFPLMVDPSFCVYTSRVSVPTLYCRPILYEHNETYNLQFELLFKFEEFDAYDVEEPREFLCYLDHARWAPLRKTRWDGDVLHTDGEFYANGTLWDSPTGTQEISRELYHMKGESLLPASHRTEEDSD